MNTVGLFNQSIILIMHTWLGLFLLAYNMFGCKINFFHIITAVTCMTFVTSVMLLLTVDQSLMVLIHSVTVMLLNWILRFRKNIFETALISAVILSFGHLPTNILDYLADPSSVKWQKWVLVLIFFALAIIVKLCKLQFTFTSSPRIYKKHGSKITYIAIFCIFTLVGSGYVSRNMSEDIGFLFVNTILAANMISLLAYSLKLELK